MTVFGIVRANGTGCVSMVMSQAAQARPYRTCSLGLLHKPGLHCKIVKTRGIQNQMPVFVFGACCAHASLYLCIQKMESKPLAVCRSKLATMFWQMNKLLRLSSLFVRNGSVFQMPEKLWMSLMSLIIRFAA